MKLELTNSYDEITKLGVLVLALVCTVCSYASVFLISVMISASFAGNNLLFAALVVPTALFVVLAIFSLVMFFVGLYEVVDDILG